MTKYGQFLCCIETFLRINTECWDRRSSLQSMAIARYNAWFKVSRSVWRVTVNHKSNQESGIRKGSSRGFKAFGSQLAGFFPHLLFIANVPMQCPLALVIFSSFHWILSLTCKAYKIPSDQMTQIKMGSISDRLFTFSGKKVYFRHFLFAYQPLELYSKSIQASEVSSISPFLSIFLEVFICHWPYNRLTIPQHCFELFF